ncbi:protein of unknown function [Methylocaldum szegediense]|uniref:Uncharacterized protein n=1 Tax=Methylocaldum szegediense TaxID=73780 RepID=A0ABN8X1S1_9GAMM|nr:protein of unknown function [Methylocaldum szegediense]
MQDTCRDVRGPAFSVRERRFCPLASGIEAPFRSGAVAVSPWEEWLLAFVTFATKMFESP